MTEEKKVEKAEEKEAPKVTKETKAPKKADDGIVVGDPQVQKVEELPLIVTLPEGASKAQIAFAKVMNAYAYQNPEKWADKKEKLTAKLRSLKTAKDPVEGKLQLGTKPNVLAN